METADDIYCRLVRSGCSVLIGDSPATRATRIRVTHPDLGGVTRFVSWHSCDTAPDRGAEALRLAFVDIERTLYRHEEPESQSE